LSSIEFDSGIGIVRYVHSLTGLSETNISIRDIYDQCQSILAKDKTLTTEGYNLKQLCHDVLQLTTNLFGKYLSIGSSNASDFLDADPFNGQSCWKEYL
jgi:hypothetical protein